MKKIYVAGAYSANNVLDVLQNIGKGKHYCAQIFAMGHAPFCPWSDEDFAKLLWSKTLTVRQFQDASMLWLEASDALFLVPGWENSKGTKAEIKRAEQLNMPIFKTLDQILVWSENQEVWEKIQKQFNQ